MGRITVASAKAKGRDLQKKVCEKIADCLGVSHGYHDDADIKPRPMGQAGVDVIIPNYLSKKFPFSIECKSGESWSIQGAIRQAKSNTKENTDWMVILRSKEFKSPIVVLDFDVFLKIMFGDKNASSDQLCGTGNNATTEQKENGSVLQNGNQLQRSDDEGQGSLGQKGK